MLAGDKVIFTRDDIDLIAKFAGCSLDEKPGSNWVQDAGGLPEFICEVARAIKKTGKSTSRAIAIAVSRVKKWAAGVGADKDTQAKAAKAIAEWEAKRAKTKAKSAAKNGGKAGSKDDKKVAASHVVSADVLCLSDHEYNVDSVRNAFDNRMRQQRDDWRKANPGRDLYEEGPQRMWVKELWNTFLIARSDYGEDASLYKVPYTVDHNSEVTFGEAAEVRTEYVVVPADDADDNTLDDAALKALMTAVPACQFSPFLTLTPAGGALERVLAAAKRHHAHKGD